MFATQVISCGPAGRYAGSIPATTAHNDEGTDEQGTESGSTPDSRIVLYLVMGREKVRSIRTPAVPSSLWQLLLCARGEPTR